MVTTAQGNLLLKIARKAIENAFEHKTLNVPEKARKQKEFSQQPGVFVTLLRDGQFCGSMGYPQNTYPLIDSVIKAARDAAFNDPRFKDVRKNGLARLRIRIDILSKFEPVDVKRIKAGKDGIFVEYGPFKALQLPEDTKKFKWTQREIVENTLRKAGLAPEMWNDKNLRIYRFMTQAFEEK